MRKLLTALLLLATAAHAQVAGPIPPKILQIDAGSGITITTNGTRRVIAAPGAAGDITAVTAGTGLTGGGSSGDVTLGLANQAQATVIGRASGAGTGTPTALTAAELATIVQGAGVFLPLTGGTLTGAVDLNYDSPELLVTSSTAVWPTIALSRIYDETYPNIYSKIQTIEGTTGSVLSEIRTTQTSATESRLSLYNMNGGSLTEIVKIESSGITISGPVTATNITSPAGVFTGNGSGLTNLDATDLTGDIPAASIGAVEIEATDRDFHLYTVEDVGWALAYVATNTTVDCVKSANTSEQDGILQSDLMRTPRGFTAYATTGALVIDWLADSTTLADIRGIRLLGYASPVSSPVIVYSDSTTRNVASVPTSSLVNASQISLNASSFTTSTIFAYYRIEVSATVEDGFCLAVLNARVVSQ